MPSSPLQLLLRLAVLLPLVHAQPTVTQGVDAGGQPQPPPLEEVLMNMFDKDKDGQITISEVLSTLDSLAALGAPDSQTGEPNKMVEMANVAKAAAPGLLRLMDADGSGSLSKEELAWVSGAYDAMKTPGLLKDLTVQLFETVDTDADSRLTEAELRAAIEGEALERMLQLLQEKLPIPSLSADTSRTLLQERFQEAMRSLDTDGDGEIERKEMFAAVKTFRQYFVSSVDLARSVGPMLAMFQAFQQPDGATAGAGRGARKKPTRTKPIREPDLS